MRILVTNDDGYTARGIQSLVKILREFGDLTIIAPKAHQSGMSMAISMGLKPLAAKKLSSAPGEEWWYLDATPASCVKFGVGVVMKDNLPDLIVSGINHGANNATAVLYSGTIGAAYEGIVNGIPSIGVSLDNVHHDADFSVVEELLPGILEKLLPSLSKGVAYNINFPDIPASQIKGVKAGHMGMAHWGDEFQPYTRETFSKFGFPAERFDDATLQAAEPGESFYLMAGRMFDDSPFDQEADHKIMEKGYVSITAHNIDNTDYKEIERLCDII